MPAPAPSTSYGGGYYSGGGDSGDKAGGSKGDGAARDVYVEPLNLEAPERDNDQQSIIDQVRGWWNSSTETPWGLITAASVNLAYGAYGIVKGLAILEGAILCAGGGLIVAACYGAGVYHLIGGISKGARGIAQGFTVLREGGRCARRCTNGGQVRELFEGVGPDLDFSERWTGLGGFYW